jgi:hypothetical protein
MVMKNLFAALPLLAASLAVSPAQAGGTCTAITSYGPVYVGCSNQGSQYTFSQPVHGYTGFEASQPNPNNPGCYDINENGISAFCTYRR